MQTLGSQRPRGRNEMPFVACAWLVFCVGVVFKDTLLRLRGFAFEPGLLSRWRIPPVDARNTIRPSGLSTDNSIKLAAQSGLRAPLSRVSSDCQRQ